MSLNDFIKKYTGVKTGNTDANMGQCVGLVSVWMDTFNIPHEFGNAKDLLNNANTQYVDVIHNTPTGVPQPGDILVWDINTYGHTAIFVSGDANNFKSFDQNWPEGSTPHIQDHNYNGVIGWLHIKASQTSQDALQACLDQHTVLVTLCDQKDATIATLTATNQDQQNRINDLEGQVSTLKNDNTNLLKDVQTAKQQASEQAAQAQKAHDEDLSAISQGLEAQHQRDSLQATINIIAQSLNLPLSSNAKTITDAITELKKDHDQVAKEATQQYLYKRTEKLVTGFLAWLKLGLKVWKNRKNQ